MKPEVTCLDTAPSRLPSLCWLLLLLLGFLILTMPRWIFINGDAVQIRAGAISLLTKGTLAVPPDYARSMGERGQYFCENSITGKWYSKYGILNSLLYIPPLLLEYGLSGRLLYFNQLDAATLARRCLYLNLYNVALSLLIFVYLLKIARLYARRERHAVFFVLLVFFCTFLWYYLRAQTVEIFQVLLFSAAFYHVIRSHRQASRHNGPPSSWLHAAVAMSLLAILSLEKQIYVLLLPMTGTAVLISHAMAAGDASLGKGALQLWRDHRRPVFLVIVVPGLTAAILILANNWYCFGSPLSTGYNQWERYKSVFSGNIGEGLYGFLFDPRKSIFLYFPVLPLSLLAIHVFAKKYPFDFTCVATVFLIYYPLNAAVVYWTGDWCYGPRYLLFLLPVLSLPLLELFASSSDSSRIRWATRLGVTTILLWTLATQPFVHAIEFLAPFRAEEHFSRFANARVREYFHQPFWTINRDLLRYRAGSQEFPPLEMLRPQLNPAEHEDLSDMVRRDPLANLYWLAPRPKTLVRVGHQPES